MGDLTTEPLAQAGRIGEPRRELERQRPRPAKPRRETARPRPSEAERSAEEVPDTPPHRFDGMA
jgi:hypothetical protein